MGVDRYSARFRERESEAGGMNAAAWEAAAVKAIPTAS